jgi:hypothetical protein
MREANLIHHCPVEVAAASMFGRLRPKTALANDGQMSTLALAGGRI